jgi:hypothetical protein
MTDEQTHPQTSACVMAKELGPAHIGKGYIDETGAILYIEQIFTQPNNMVLLTLVQYTASEEKIASVPLVMGGHTRVPIVERGTTSCARTLYPRAPITVTLERIERPQLTKKLKDHVAENGMFFPKDYVNNS